MINNTTFNNLFNSPIRDIEVVVAVHTVSSTEYTWDCQNCLKSFTVERVGEEGKFFGFGIVHRLNLQILDPNREVDLTDGRAYEIEVMYRNGNSYLKPYPFFYITEINRDENTNELSITAYDALYEATQHTMAEIELSNIGMLWQFVEACASTFDCNSGETINIPYDVFNSSAYYYPLFLNFDGTETIREVLDDVAEYTQSIYYVDTDFNVIFKRLDKDAEPLFTIDKEKYFKLDSKTNRRLATIIKTTELGDNVSATTGVSGTTQYVRNNGFYDLLDAKTLATHLNEAIAAVGGLTINQFECEWRGNPLLEIGDKIALVTKDNETVISYLLDDVITFNGGFSEKSRWAYVEGSEGETHSNPVTLGEALKKTYAKVDKVNEEITIIAGETAGLKIDAETITTSVNSIKEDMDDTNGAIKELTKKVDATMTSEQVNIAIQQQLANGVNSVTTTTGFTFNQDGLTVSKSGKEISTTITEDGMTINKNGNALLTANNVGVEAANLHATTYLIVGKNSRFEDYDDGKRTGCFWIVR